MAAINRMIYLSPGNLPSQMAHTAQIAKMAQAFAQQVNRFELVIGSVQKTMPEQAETIDSSLSGPKFTQKSDHSRLYS